MYCTSFLVLYQRIIPAGDIIKEALKCKKAHKMLIQFYRLPKKCITSSYKLLKQWYVMRFRWQTRLRQQQAKSDKFNLCFNFAVMDYTCRRVLLLSSRWSGRLWRWQHTVQHYICHLWRGLRRNTNKHPNLGWWFFCFSKWSQGRAQGTEELEQTALTEKVISVSLGGTDAHAEGFYERLTHGDE